MTAEISIMNKSAVALAADSAVTVSDKKVYNTGSKLFPVTHGMPIGIMFYGNMNLLGMPLETVLASFRKHIDKKKFESVKECGETFINFLRNSEDLYPLEAQKEYYLHLLKNKFQELSNNIKLINESREIDETTAKEVIKNEFYKRFKEQNEAPYVDGIVEYDKNKLIADYTSDFDTIINNSFKNHSSYGISKTDLYDLSANYACKALPFSNDCSGVVFCGFGEKENYPSLYAIELEFIIQNKPNFIVYEQFKITNSQAARISAFAQKDEVFSFLSGIDPCHRWYKTDTSLTFN